RLPVVPRAALHAAADEVRRPLLGRLAIGYDPLIGVDTLVDPSYPHRVVIGRRVAVGMRVLILAHFAHHGRNRESSEGTMDDRVSVRIEDDAFIGPGVMIMPNVTIAAGAVVAAGSVVTR